MIKTIIKIWTRLTKNPFVKTETTYTSRTPDWECLIGKDFIVITNEIDPPPVKAKFLGKEIFKDTYSYPIWEDENGNKFYCGGIALSYNEELWKFVQSLDQSKRQAWDMFYGMLMDRDKLHDDGKNKSTTTEIVWG